MKKIFPILALFLFIAVLFLQSVNLRKDSFGKLAADELGGGGNTSWVSLSHYALLFAKNWDTKGALNMKLRLQINPHSIEMGW